MSETLFCIDGKYSAVLLLKNLVSCFLMMIRGVHLSFALLIIF